MCRKAPRPPWGVLPMPDLMNLIPADRSKYLSMKLEPSGKSCRKPLRNHRGFNFQSSTGDGPRQNTAALVRLLEHLRQLRNRRWRRQLARRPFCGGRLAIGHSRPDSRPGLFPFHDIFRFHDNDARFKFWQAKDRAGGTSTGRRIGDWNHHNRKPPADGRFGGGEISRRLASVAYRTIPTVPNNCSME